MRAIIFHHQTLRAHQQEKSKTLKQRGMAVVLSIGMLVTGSQFIPQAFGKPSIASSIGLAIEGQFIDQLGGNQIKQQAAEQVQVSQESTATFLAGNKNRTKNLEVGDTFIPEQFLPPNVTNPLAFIQTPEGQIWQQNTLDILEATVEDVGIQEERIGLRWSSTLFPDGTFSLAFYKPYLDFLTSYKNPITHQPEDIELGVGPDKSVGWPESHIPVPPENLTNVDTSLIPLGKLPPVGSEITPTMPYPDFLKKSELWLNLVMQQVVPNYPTITDIQLDNEPQNAFGPQQYTLSAEWEKAELKIVLKYKPNANFLVNFAGTANIAGSVDIKNPPNLEKAISEAVTLLQLKQKFTEQSVIQKMINYKKVLTDAIKEYGGKGQVTIGTDYYHLTSNNPSPIKVSVNGKDYEVFVDTNTLIDATEAWAGDSHPWATLNSNQVTEVQAENWTPFTSPGNDPNTMRFAIQRALDDLPTNKPSLIGLYQVSPLVGELMNDSQAFYTNADPKKMTDPTGQFTANDQAELELIAGLTGVSTLKTINGKLVLDNTNIDNFISQYANINTGNSGSNISVP